MPSNEKLHLLPFDIKISQNNQTLEKASGITEVGSSIFLYTFSEPDPITVRIENVGILLHLQNLKHLFYQNPNTTSQLTDNTNNNNQDSNLVVAPVALLRNSSFLTHLAE